MIQLEFLFLFLVQILQAYHLPQELSENSLNHTVVPSKAHFSPLSFKVWQAPSQCLHAILHSNAEIFFQHHTLQRLQR